MESIAPAHVVAQLRATPRLLHVYLDALWDKDPKAGAAFHELQASCFTRVALHAPCPSLSPIPLARSTL